MKKDTFKLIITICLSVFFVWGFVYAANTFPGSLNGWDDGDIIESDWADALEVKIGIDGSKATSSLDYKTSINIQLQGTASASYGLFSNTLQINGFASAAYSRFGTNTTTSSFLSGANDLLITGKFEVDSSVSFDGGLKGSGLTDCDTATTSKLLWDATTAHFICGTDTDTVGSTASNSLNFDEFQNPLVLDIGITTTSASFNWDWGATSLINVGTVSFSKWINVGGVAGVRIDGDGDGAITFLGLGNGSDENFTINLDDTANTGVWSSSTGLNKFDFGAIGLELDASTNLTLGANTLNHDGTTFVFNDDAVFNTGAGSSSFAGSLDVTKGIHGLSNITATSTITGSNLSGTNTGDVTLAGTPNYLTLSGQQITLTKLDISDDTNATGGTGITLSTNDFSFASTEVEATTWGAGGNASNLWTFNLSAGDPTLNWTQSGASLSLNFEVIGYASASLFDGTAFGGIDCNDAAEGLQWSGGTFTCRAWVDADIPDGITVNGGVIGSNNISATSTWTTLGTLTIGDGGDRVDFATDTWDVANGVFTGLTLGSLSISSAATWTTLGTLTIGDNGDAVNFDTSTWDVSAGVFSGVAGMTGTGVYDFGGATSFEIPQNGTVNATGEITVHTTSNSFDWYNGTRIVVQKEEVCFTYVVDTPTAANPGRVQGKRFNDPFTITSVQPVASGSNAAGWNLLYGAPGSVTTSVFTLAKSASISSYPTYTSFANSTLLDGNNLDVIITSRSAVLQTFSVNVCGRATH